MRRLLLVPGTAAVLVVAAIAAAGPAGAVPTTTRLSSSSTGLPANGASELPGLSDDGRFATFTSDGSNLVPETNNFIADVFVKDRLTGAVDKVSVSSTGEEGNRSSGGFLRAAPITPDGRFVAFDSDAFNLVPGDTNNLTDVFVRDRVAHTTVRVSVSTTGTQGNGNSGVDAISADGRYVLLSSRATNLVPNDTNGLLTDVFLRDIATGTTTLLSVTRAGAQVPNDTLAWDMSNDGRFVAFSSLSPYTADDRNTDEDAYVKDLRTGSIERISVTSKGRDFPGGSRFGRLSLSADGRFVAFETTADDIGSPGPGNFSAVYVRDLQAKTTVLASVTGTGVPIPQSTGETFLCDTGVAFNSFYPNVTAPPSDQEQVYFRSR